MARGGPTKGPQLTKWYTSELVVGQKEVTEMMSIDALEAKREAAEGYPAHATERRRDWGRSDFHEGAETKGGAASSGVAFDEGITSRSTQQSEGI
ncbi:hypothetical protein THIOKS13330046 [Thiocapsa sp. KS1]|nr:hypothetical protein THIOKS13330046 [Thiocapsa sp. KS1]